MQGVKLFTGFSLLVTRPASTRRGDSVSSITFTRSTLLVTGLISLSGDKNVRGIILLTRLSLQDVRGVPLF